jgi:hypothetical protein
MIALGANKLIMKSKFKKALLVNFDLMIILATNKLIVRSKLKKALLANFDLMKKRRDQEIKSFLGILTS